MAINPRQVEAFRAVMLTGQITNAAELLSITQPAVSRLIQDFERAVDLNLFDRRGNRVQPRPEAFTLLAEVERSFVGLTQIAEHADAIRKGGVGTLRIACLPALAMGAVPRFAAHFLRDNPEVRLTVSGMLSHLVIEAVAAGQADIGYAIGPLDRVGVRSERVDSNAVVILPEGHQLAALPEVRVADLVPERMIALGAGTLFRSRVDAAFGDLPRNIVAETPLSQIACIMVCEGIGVSIVDPYAAHEYIGRGLIIRPFKPDTEFSFMQLRHGSTAGSPLVRNFIEGFAAYRRQIEPNGG